MTGHQRHRSPHLIYSSWLHVTATIAFIALPVVAFLLLPLYAGIAATVLFGDVSVSLFRIAAAYAIAAVLGWILAVSVYRGRRATVGLPAFDVLQSFPTFAALPLAISVWGPSNFTVIVFLVFTILWPIFFSVISSLKLIKRDWREVVEIYGLSGAAYVKKFLLPITLPGLITGSVVGLGEGWEALIATEIIVGTDSGLGNFFERFSGNPGVTAFGILTFLLLIFGINKLVWLSLLEWGHRRMEE